MNLIFDFDGTLNESSITYMPAFREAVAYLRSTGYAVREDISDEQIGYWLGFSSKEMWSRFAPDLDDERKQTCSKMTGEIMLKKARNGEARLYPGIPETLQALKDDGHTLIFLSNCHHDYYEIHRDAFDLGKYFDAFYCGEDFDWQPKTQIFATIRDRFGTPGCDPASEFIVIGDRFHDMSVAEKYGLKAVGCAYGFGSRDELAAASVIIDDASEMLGAIRSLC